MRLKSGTPEIFSPSPAVGNDDDNDDDYYDDDDVYYYYISPPSLRGNHKQDMTRTGLIYQRDWREKKNILCNFENCHISGDFKFSPH